MANPGYTARAVISWKAGLVAVPALTSRFLGLLTTAPSDADSGGVEVAASTYARVQIAGSVATNAAVNTQTLSFAAVPAWVQAGMTALDLTSPTAISAGTTVLAKTGTSVTLSAPPFSTVGNGDLIVFSAFPAASGAGPSVASTVAALQFNPTGNVAWGSVVAAALFDSLTGGNMLDWDWLGDDQWFPFTAVGAGGGSTFAAPGITAGSSPNLANGSLVVATERFDGSTIPAGMLSETAYTVASLANDSFSLGASITGTGAGMMRQITQQAVPINTTFTVPVGSYSIYLA